MRIEPADVLKQIAMAAGYRVHVWDAVENGDATDSYFWKASRLGADGPQSVLTFLSPEDAWRDCCEANGLLAPIAQELEENGCRVVRERGFIAYRWVSSDGYVSPGPFVSAAEALIACAMFLAEDDRHGEYNPCTPSA